MKIAIYETLLRTATRMLLAYTTPEQIIGLMKIFHKLFSADENFVPFDKWGKDVHPFTLSERGMSRIQALRSNELFDKVYRGGTAGMKKPYNLLYFLTQTLLLLSTNLDALELKVQMIKDEKKKEILSNILDKFKSVGYRISPRALYEKDIPRKEYTQQEYNKAKQKVLEIIDKVMHEYESVDLSPDEESYWKASLTP